MILDSQSLSHLEIFENQDGGQTGSLFNFINNTVSPFGQRLLKKWLLNPLLSIDNINSRYEAIEDLNENPYILEKLRSALKKLPDMERITTRIYQYSVR